MNHIERAAVGHWTVTITNRIVDLEERVARLEVALVGTGDEKVRAVTSMWKELTQNEKGDDQSAP